MGRENVVYIYNRIFMFSAVNKEVYHLQDSGNWFITVFSVTLAARFPVRTEEEGLAGCHRTGSHGQSWKSDRMALSSAENPLTVPNHVTKMKPNPGCLWQCQTAWLLRVCSAALDSQVSVVRLPTKHLCFCSLLGVLSSLIRETSCCGQRFMWSNWWECMMLACLVLNRASIPITPCPSTQEISWKQGWKEHSGSISAVDPVFRAWHSRGHGHSRERDIAVDMA